MAAIITYAEVEDLTRKTFSTAERSALNGLILMVEEYIKSVVLDWTKETAASHTYLGTGTRYLWLRRYCTSLTSVTINGTALDTDDYTLWNHIAIRLKADVFAADEDDIVVTGNWGFEAADAPSDFKFMLALLCAKCLWEYGSREVTSESVGKVSMSYLDSAYKSDAILRGIIRKYSPVKVA